MSNQDEAVERIIGRQPYTPSLYEAREDYAEEGFNAPHRRAQFDRMIEAVRAEERAEFRDALAEAGLPETATLADLIRHHRANAGLVAALDAERVRAEERQKAAQIAEAAHAPAGYLIAPDIAARIREQGKEQDRG